MNHTEARVLGLELSSWFAAMLLHQFALEETTQLQNVVGSIDDNMRHAKFLDSPATGLALDEALDVLEETLQERDKPKKTSIRLVSMAALAVFRNLFEDQHAAVVNYNLEIVLSYRDVAAAEDDYSGFSEMLETVEKLRKQ